MSDTPEREIEKQLRQHAEARRNAAGEPSLHPAARRVLQAEVRQRWGGADGRHPAASGSARFWPRFALAFGLLAIMVTAAVLLLGPDEKGHADFAKLQDRSELEFKLEASGAAKPASGTVDTPGMLNAPAPVASARPMEDSLSKRFAESSVGGSAVFADNESAAPKAAAPATDEYSVATALASKSAAPAPEGQFFASSSLTTATDGRDGLSSPAKKDVRDGLAKFNLEELTTTIGERETLGRAQAFRNVVVPASEKDKQPAIEPVLLNFTVAQNGNQLTVVDEDGSVYNGTVEPVALVGVDQTKEADTVARRSDLPTAGGAGGKARATFESNQLAARTATAAPALDIGMDAAAIVPAAEAQNWQFKVEGTNRSLRQRVIFTGNLIQNSGANDIFINNQSGLGNRQNFQQQPAAQNQFNFYNHALPQNNAINGRVKLGDRKETELNALSVEP